MMVLRTLVIVGSVGLAATARADDDAQDASALDGTMLPLHGTTAGAALLLAPRAGEDGEGVAIGGASSLENTYLLDGARINNATFGNLTTVVPVEIVRSIEVSTGGWDAASTGALGAVARIVTRSGGDQLHGSVFATLAPSWMAGTPKTVPTAAQTIDVRSELAYDASVGATLSGPIVPHHLWFFAAFAPQLARTDDRRRILSQTDCRQPGTLGPCTQQLADGQPDVDPRTGAPITDVVATEIREAPSRAYATFARLDLDLGDDRAFLSALVTPYSADQPALIGAPSTGSQLRGVASDVAARWQARYYDGQLGLEAAASWHHLGIETRALDPAAEDVQSKVLLDATLADIAPFESPAAIRGCTDGGPGDRYPGIVNCPLGAYATGGPGTLGTEVDDRMTEHVAARGTIEAAGVHRLEAGGDLEIDRSSWLRWDSGGAVVETDVMGKIQYVDRLVRLSPSGSSACESSDGQAGTQLFRCDDVTASSPPNDEQTTRWAAYVRDGWEPHPGLHVDAGVRYERQRVYDASTLQDTTDPLTGERYGEVAFDVHGVAPRAGLTFDPTGDGSAKLFAHWGRSFEAIPLDLNNRSLTSSLQYEEVFSTGMFPGPLRQRLIDGRGTRTGSGLRPQYGDDLVAGGELAVTSDLEVSALYEQRSIGRVLEDASNDGAASYTIINPGETPGFTAFDKPRRDDRAVTVALAQRLGRHGLARASYTYARTEGNYAGLLGYEDGQVDPNVSTQYDLIELLANRAGPLPQDRPSWLTLEAYDALPIHREDAVVLGVVMIARSGTPESALGGHYLYGPNESFLLPRGSLGRTPLERNLDVHVGYRRALGHGTTLDAFIDVLDADDAEGVTGVDMTYAPYFRATGPQQNSGAQQNANPISGGSYRDLIWLKTIDFTGDETNIPIGRNPNFLKPTSYQAPISARLGLRLTF